MHEPLNIPDPSRWLGSDAGLCSSPPMVVMLLPWGGGKTVGATQPCGVTTHPTPALLPLTPPYSLNPCDAPTHPRLQCRTHSPETCAAPTQVF